MPIGAHLAPPARGGSQRAAPRRALRLVTSGTLPGGESANVTVHNLSAAGLLLESAVELAVGERLLIDMPEAGAIDAVIVWRSAQLYGCAFEDALDPRALAAAQLRSEPVNGPLRARGETLGVRLNRLRRESGQTLADVASALGVSKPTVWAWEKGKARPLPERLAAIAEVLGVSPSELAGPENTFADAGSVIDACRERIAQACGVTPAAVRIMLEL